MPVVVSEVMNRELYTAKADEPIGPVLKDLLNLGISGGPVVDEEHRPIGVFSLRDLANADPEATIKEKMTTPPLVIRKEQPLHDAAVLMGETGYHRLVVVDGERAVGLVSSLDIIRGLVGMPVQHPSTFPHYDARTGAVWTDELLLDYAHVEGAPDSPGIFIIIDGGAGRPERVVWGETTNNVRRRLMEYLGQPHMGPTLLSYWRKLGNLRFRAAAVADPADRKVTLERALGDAR